MTLVKTLHLSTTAFLLASCATTPPPFDEATAVQRARQITTEFQSQLLAALTTAMQQGGPTRAISVCAAQAPAIAAALSAREQAQVRRTALRVRNPAAAPDDFEREALRLLQAAPLGADGQQAERHAVQRSGAAREFRYLRAIPTAAPCLACHGETLAPEVAAALRARYPADEATGFKPGELRGAFSLRWAL